MEGWEDRQNILKDIEKNMPKEQSSYKYLGPSQRAGLLAMIYRKAKYI